MLHAVRANSNILATALLALSVLVLLARPAPLAAQERIMLILDSSGSMWGQVEGVNKYLIAREVIGTVLEDLDEDVDMGVMAYGHRRKGDCKDIQTLIPVGPVDPKKYMSRIKRIKPRGKTPISAAVRRAAQALKYTEDKATIVLVSDGLETCDADPCALASELEELGVDFTVHVVGFDLGNEDVATLSCLAENTGGKFLQASNADELTDAFSEVVEAVQEPEPEPEVVQVEPDPEPEPVAGPTLILPRAYLVEGGERLEDAYFRVYAPEADAEGKRTQITYGGGKPKLEAAAGRYYITAKHGDALAGVEVEIEAGKQNVVDIVLNAGLVRPIAYLAEGVEPIDDAYFRVYDAQTDAEGKRRQVTYGGGKPLFTVPAGPHHITAKRGDALAGNDVEIVPGELHKVHIVLNAGIVIPSALWSEGGDPVKDAYFRIYDAAEDADGKRRQVTYGGGAPRFTVPAGEYYITAKVGDALIGNTIAVAPGEATQVSLILGAGVLKPTAYYTEGGDQVDDAYYRVYEPEPDASGKRRQVTYGGGTPSFKLPAGKYHVTAKIGEALVGKDVEVLAGQPTEVSLVLGAGVLSLFAAASEGGDTVRKVYFRVYAAKKDIEGNRKQVTAGGGQPKFQLPAGTYLVTAKWGQALAEREVEVTAGELTEATVTLNAGRVVARAVDQDGTPVAKGVYYRLFAAKKDIEGNRKQLTAGGGKSLEAFVPAGKYVIQVSVGPRSNIAGTLDIEVGAGELVEVQVPVTTDE